jgi:hypothetical protein
LKCSAIEQKGDMQAMQGGAPTKTPEEEALQDTELDDLAVEEHKQRDADTMQALSMLYHRTLAFQTCICIVETRACSIMPWMASLANYCYCHRQTDIREDIPERAQLLFMCTESASSVETDQSTQEASSRLS